LKNCWHGQPGIEPTIFDLTSQSGAYDLSATATPLKFTNFSIFFPTGQARSKSTRVKDGLACYLVQVKSVLGSGQGSSLEDILAKLLKNLLLNTKFEITTYHISKYGALF